MSICHREQQQQQQQHALSLTVMCIRKKQHYDIYQTAPWEIPHDTDKGQSFNFNEIENIWKGIFVHGSHSQQRKH